MEDILKFGPLTERPDEERIEVKITTPSDLELDTHDVNYPPEPGSGVSVEITCHLKKITPQSDGNNVSSFTVTTNAGTTGELLFTVDIDDGSNVETVLVAKKKRKPKVIYLDHVILTHSY